MFKNVFQWLTLAMLIVCVVSCKPKKRENLIPPITGKAGEVVVVMEEDLYKGVAGDTLFNIICQEEPALPQSGMEGAEPMFNIVQIPRDGFSNIFRSHRNILIVTINKDLKSSKIKTDRNYWSREQLLIRIEAPTKEALVEQLDKNRDFLVMSLREAEIDRQVLLNRKYENLELANVMARDHQINMSFPKGFQPKVDTGQFLWVEYSPEDMIQGVLIWYTDYTDESELDYANLVRTIDEHIKPRVLGEPAGSYMAIEFDAPLYSRTFEHNESFSREIRGLWEMVGDFMGGPFISWTLVDEKRQRLITLFGFVYAPKYQKRNHIRKVESILKTIDLTD